METARSSTYPQQAEVTRAQEVPELGTRGLLRALGPLHTLRIQQYSQAGRVLAGSCGLLLNLGGTGSRPTKEPFPVWCSGDKSNLETPSWLAPPLSRAWPTRGNREKQISWHFTKEIRKWGEVVGSWQLWAWEEARPSCGEWAGVPSLRGRDCESPKCGGFLRGRTVGTCFAGLPPVAWGDQ